MQASPREISWQAPTGTLGELTRAAWVRAESVAGSLNELQDRAADGPIPPKFAAALRGDTVRIIAEVKRASPSKGDIAPNIDAAQQAAAYATGGAAAISVLTEPARFGGSLADLTAVSGAVGIPALRKDFIVHPVQLWEARLHGASAALLIVRALSQSQLERLMQAARDAGLETLVEVRDDGELARALAVGAEVIGVNNRNLETLEIDTSTAPRLIAHIPAHILAVAESGLRTVVDMADAARAGADAVLVGSAISAAHDPREAVRALTGVPRTAR